MSLLVLDPSIRSAGVAIFVGGELVAATTIKEPGGRTKRAPVRRCAWMSQQVIDWALTQGVRPTEYVTEWPKIYPPGRGKPAPSKSIPGLSGVGTGVACALMNTPALVPLHGVELECFSYLPEEWVMGTDKNVAKGASWWECSRHHRIVKRILASEKRVWCDQVTSNDAMDAVGIGLYHLGRFTRMRA